MGAIEHAGVLAQPPQVVLLPPRAGDDAGRFGIALHYFRINPLEILAQRLFARAAKRQQQEQRLVERHAWFGPSMRGGGQTEIRGPHRLGRAQMPGLRFKSQANGPQSSLDRWQPEKRGGAG